MGDGPGVRSLRCWRWIRPLVIPRTESTITASIPWATWYCRGRGKSDGKTVRYERNELTSTLTASLFKAPYETQTSPDSLTMRTRRGASTSGSAWETIPSRFHRDANRTASCRLLARISPTGEAPASVRNSTGMEGCLKAQRRQMSGLKLENSTSRPPPRSYTLVKTVSTNELSSTA